MAGATIPEQPVVTVPDPARRYHHTRWFLIVLYALAVVWGARNVYFWDPSRLDLLFPVTFAVVLWSWAVIDARRRRHPIPLLAQDWFFLGAGVLVPLYVLWSRRWAGLGWLVLHSALWFVLATAVMLVGGLIVFGSE